MTYPNTPRVFPDRNLYPQALSALALFEETFMKDVFWTVLPIHIAKANSALHPYSREYFRRMREVWFGCKLEELAPPGSQRRADKWKKVRKGLDKLAATLDRRGGQYLFGNTFSRAEIIMIAFLSSIPVYAEPGEWEAIARANGGRWGRLIERTRDIQMVKD